MPRRRVQSRKEKKVRMAKKFGRSMLASGWAEKKKCESHEGFSRARKEKSGLTALMIKRRQKKLPQKKPKKKKKKQKTLQKKKPT